MPYTWDVAGEVVDIRHSFMKVPKSDYIKLPMPPTVFQEDGNGQPVLDQDGYAVRVPINDRFGFFGTLGRNQFDQNRGLAVSGQMFYGWTSATRSRSSTTPTSITRAAT
jgi:hypothetical protein